MPRRAAQMRVAAVAVAAAVAAVAVAAAPRVEAAGQKIAWYSTLKQGLQVARSSGRPILLLSAAPHCRGISGMW